VVVKKTLRYSSIFSTTVHALMPQFHHLNIIVKSGEKREVVMKNKWVFGLALLLLFAPGIARAEAPHQVGGFALGRNIEEYKDRVIMDTALPVRYSENMEELEIKFTQGFKSGLITYGTCAKPGQIVKIKMSIAAIPLVLLRPGSGLLSISRISASVSPCSTTRWIQRKKRAMP